MTTANRIVVAIFPSRKILLRALDHLNETQPVTLKRAAIVARARNGETVILDDDISPDEGGIAGGTLGAAMLVMGMVNLGALALPGVGPVIALGGSALVGGLLGRVTGRFAANLIDSGFRNDQIEALAQQLEEGHPALVMEIDHLDETLAILRQELKTYDAELIEPLHRASTGNLPAPDDV